MNQYVIIVAGGRGTRMRNASARVSSPESEVLPKQFMDLGGLPVLMRTINVFERALTDPKIILVLGKEIIPLWRDLCIQYNFHSPACSVAVGGEERFHSVRNGLALINEDAEAVVGVHDGVRPLVSEDVIRRAYHAAETACGVVPVLKSVESVRLLDNDGRSRAVNREKVMMVQTPQVFPLRVLRRAYEQPFSSSFTDDASVVESAGFAIQLVEGNRENIKLTTPADLLFARALLKATQSD